MDNLEAQTYETFEKDSVKYIQVSRIFWADIYFYKYILLLAVCIYVSV